MALDRKLELMLKKKIELERLKVETDTIKYWKDKINQPLQNCKDFRSLQSNLKKLLQAMENRIHINQSEIRTKE